MPQLKLATFNIGKGATKYLPENYKRAHVETNLDEIAQLIKPKIGDPWLGDHWLVSTTLTC